MPVNRRYIKELSDMFVDDLRRSDYYRQLTAPQRDDLEDRLTSEAEQGYYPLVPNGVTMYGVDGDLRDDQFDAVPGLLAENSFHWASFPETIQKYLFIGDADLWHFAIELDAGTPVVLHKGTLTEAHRFSSLEELVDDMLHQALGYFEDKVDYIDNEPTDYPAGFQFSRS